MEQLVECNIEKGALHTGYVYTHKSLPLDNITKREVATMEQLEECNTEKGAIGGTLGTILLALFGAVIVVLVMFIIYQQKRIGLQQQKPVIISNPVN